MTTVKRFGVWCCETGGVFGFRSAWLKSNDELRVFDSLDAARSEAAQLNRRMNHPLARASFLYEARPLDLANDGSAMKRFWP